MKISTYTGGMAQTNAYLVETPNGNFLVDAPDGVDGWVAKKGVRVDAVLLTHQHFDHVEAVASLQKAGAKVYGFAPYSKELTLEALPWGIPVAVEPYQVDEVLDLSQPLTLVDMEFELSHIPGHAKDSVTYHLANEKTLFSGDTIFAGSIGRTDLPGGSTEQLVSGIRKYLLPLPDDTRVLSGHGPATTIGREKGRNPYL